jgi:hypothetical protein
MRSWGPRKDPDGVVQHRAVATAGTYRVDKTLWRRKVAGGTITCELLRRVEGPGKRPVRLIADYEDAGVACQDVIYCETPMEEQEAMGRLERKILKASLHGPIAAAGQEPAATPTAP